MLSLRSLVLRLQLGLMLVLAGCDGTEVVPTNPPAPTALTLDEWKKLPIPEKYDESAFERLRLADPKLKSDSAWRAFMKKEIMPERDQDIPRAPAAPQTRS